MSYRGKLWLTFGLSALATAAVIAFLCAAVIWPIILAVAGGLVVIGILFLLIFTGIVSLVFK